MEKLNLLIILFTTFITLLWARRKRKELSQLKLEQPDKENNPLNPESEEAFLIKAIEKDQPNLKYVSRIFKEIQGVVIFRLFWLLFFISFILSICIWRFFEEKKSEYAQGIFFFSGSISQICIAMIVIQSHNFYDPRILFLARLSKWYATDYIIKLNSFLTILN